MNQERYLDFKTGDLRRQWRQGQLHPALRVIVTAAARWHWLATGKQAVVTSLLRTREQQRKIYPSSPGKRSPHEFGRAADMRVSLLHPGRAGDWARWLNEAFPYQGRTGLKTALVHEVGGRGNHIHVQVGPGETLPSQR